MADDVTVTVTVGRTISPKPFHSIRTEVTLNNVPLDAAARGIALKDADAVVRAMLMQAHDLAEAEAQRIESEQYDGPPVVHAVPATAVAPESKPSGPPPKPPAGRQWVSDGGAETRGLELS